VTTAGRGRGFETTQWSVVLAATGDDTAAGRDALETLCERYWYPLYAFVRRGGTAVHEAQDLTQGFFATVLEKDYLAAADRERGRFRTFLIAAFKNYVSKERDRARAQKRGGDRVRLSLDFEEGERRYVREPVDELTPERIYERRWGLTVLDNARDAVRAHYTSSARAGYFDTLVPFIAAGTARPTYDEVGAKLDLSESAVKSAIRRLRLRYRDALRAEIAETVPADDDVEDEIRALMDAVAG